MSTFGGKIKEIPGISIDRFDGDNFHSDVFFLSHCHADHMQGLRSSDFLNMLNDENRFIYMSAISARIVKKFHPDVNGRIQELTITHATPIEVNNKICTVTCIPSGHCPGSIMFLFESRDVRILYTGDYRIGPSDIRKFKCFYNNFNQVKVFDSIYLDTTFFSKDYYKFPKREESLSELCNIISAWISLDCKNVIKLDVPSHYGYEYIFRELFLRFHTPIHVDIEKFNLYSLIPELDKCLTIDGSSTNLHCCSLKNICSSIDIIKLRRIKLSAFRWKNVDIKQKLHEVDELQNVFYVCYSTHASYEEGSALIDFLKPKVIHICAERRDIGENLEMKRLIDYKLMEVNRTNGTIPESNEPKLFSL